MAKRKKKINTTLILGLAGGALAVVGGSYALYSRNHVKHPEVYIAAGDEAAKQRDYLNAAQNYQRAAGMLPLNAEIHLKLGKVYYQLRSQGGQYFDQCRAELTSAEELNPDYKEAWAGLLEVADTVVTQFEASPNATHNLRLATWITTARDAAEHLTSLDANNLQARIASDALQIRVWLLKMAIPPTPKELRSGKQLTDDQRVDEAIADLTGLMSQHPENDIIPYWIARAKINQAAIVLDATPNSPDAVPLFAEAASEFDNSIGVQPKNIRLYLKKAEILFLLQKTDPFAATVATYQHQIRLTLDSAQSLVDMSNAEEYQLAKAQWARYLSKSDPARAEEVYRDLITRLSALPQYQLNALQYRLELADLLSEDASRQKDALVVLDAIPSMPPATLTTYEHQQSWGMGVAYAKLCRAKIDTQQLARQPQGKAYDNLVADCSAALDAAQTRLSGRIELLEARARFQLATGHLRDAIQTATLAADKSTEQNGSVPYRLLRLEVDCYQQGGQTGRAIDLLEGEIKKNAQLLNNGELQQTLANLYLENKDYTGAKPHVDWLKVRAPDDPSVISLEIQQLGDDPDPAVALPLFKQLPEATPSQRQIKINICDTFLKNPDETIRLLKLQHTSDPGAVEPARRLILYSLNTGDREGARKVLAELSAANPTEAMLPVFSKLIDGGTPEQLFEQQLDLAAKIADPLDREVQIANVYHNAGRSDDELKHLLAAAAVRPDDKVILQRIFFLYKDSERFADAEAMLPHLSAIDADSAHGLMLRAKLALSRKDTQSALIAARQLTKDAPEFAGSWEIYGEALEANGEAESAVAQYNSAIEKQATNVDARRGLIRCSEQQGKFEDARRYIKEARERFPDDPVYQEMEVVFEIHYGDPESIIPTVTRSLKDHPDVLQAYSINAEALIASSRAAAGRGDSVAANQYLDRAKGVYQQAIERWPDQPSCALGFAQLCMEMKDVPSAESALKTLAARPHWANKPLPLQALAQIEMQAGKLDVADGLLKKAVLLDPNNLQARKLLADCLVEEKQYEDALATLKPACGEFTVLDKYVRLLLSLARGSEAEDTVVAARKNDTTNAGLTDLLIDVYQSEHKVGPALELANTAIASDTSNIGAYLRRGELEGSGINADLDAARKDLRQYCDAVPTDVSSRIMLSEVMERSRDLDGAVRELQTAVKYGPLNRQARLMLLRDYLFSKPPRSKDAELLLTETLAIPQFQHDPMFEMQEAKLFAANGDGDRAFAAAHDAMSHADDKASILNDYLAILLAAKKYSRVLDESNAYANDTKTSWPVFTYRGAAKALSGDKTGAIEEYQTALDRAGSAKGSLAARTVARDMATQLGDPSKALEIIAPRAKNSAMWTLVTVELYEMAKNRDEALKRAESAMATFDTLDPADQDFLLDCLSDLYIRATPPKVPQAVEIYQKQYARNPTNIDAMNNIASVLVDMTTPPRPREAVVWSKKAYDICKQNNLMLPAIFDTHGWVLILCGQLDEGISVLHEAVDKSDFPDAHYHLAMGYLLQKHPEDAKRDLDKAIEMISDPHSSYIMVDQNLKSKIDAAEKTADQMIQQNAAPPTPVTAVPAPN